MSDYKIKTRQAYNLFTPEFEAQYMRHFSKYTQKEADLFITEVKKIGNQVIDLGSGPGIHAPYFVEKGLDVLCVDNSEAMIDACRKKGLKAVVMDFEKLILPSGAFDGVWAYTSLFHAPRANIHSIRDGIIDVLKPEGLLGIAVKEGRGEGLETDERYPGIERWFTYYTDDEMRSIFEPKFETIFFAPRSSTDVKYLSYHFKLKPRIK